MKTHVLLLMAVALLCFAGCRRQEAPALLEDWPKTLEEATARLISEMSEADKKTVRETRKEDLIWFHMGWGTGIRNDFGLWQGNHALLKSCGKRHPDDASMVIIENVWMKLNKQGGAEQASGGTNAPKK